MDKLIIYTQGSCRQSDKVRNLLNAKGIRYMEKDISYDVLLKREMIERSGGLSTTPQVFLAGKRVASLEELQKMLGISSSNGKSRAA